MNNPGCRIETNTIKYFHLICVPSGVSKSSAQRANTILEPSSLGSKEPALQAVGRTGSHWVSSHWKVFLFSDVARFMLNGNVNIHKTDILVPKIPLQSMKSLYVVLDFEFGVQQMWAKSPDLHFILKRAVNFHIVLWRINGLKMTYGYFMQQSSTSHTPYISMTGLKEVFSRFESVRSLFVGDTLWKSLCEKSTFLAKH